MPCTQPHTATVMNSPILVALAGTPTIRAASLLPPTAKIQLPTLLRDSTHAPMIVMTTNHRIATLNPARPMWNMFAANTLRPNS